ncbi:succinylglutamate desuccinylase [Photobacterium profundum]|uniref:Succinylglutamate desuccinylase n=1 Tax=Photobacterium profundum 3TCK TaxID=314280 RepID=Q1Z8G5_9GAMM|nr:succinylglutamate desuccinylase [Photobacterium profundum]EAS45143.1 succinylglutamate desuccinylase [Photobacterium profundum 3TCK]PSV60536.1 succinylglutamate desuccinylase [Photobacterium profundum]
MASLQSVKEGGFLTATLDLALPFEAGKWALESGVEFDLSHRGILTITPPKVSALTKDIIVSAGVHGDETGPIELVQEMAQSLLQGKLVPVHRLLLIIGHPQAINVHTRFIEENMNRLFSERNDETNIDRINANQLQYAVDDFYQKSPLLTLHHDQALPDRWHLDLHCAIRDSVHYTFAVSPYSEKTTRSGALFSFLQQAEIEAILLSSSPSPTFSWYSAENYGAQGLTMELGKVARLGENDLTRLAPFAEMMQQLICSDTLDVSWDDSATNVYRVTRSLAKKSDDFSFTFPSNQANFTFFEHGKLLAQDCGVKYYSLEGGEAVVFPNPNVALGQRACLLVQQTDVKFGEQVTIAN